MVHVLRCAEMNGSQSRGRRAGWRKESDVVLPENELRELALFAGAGGGILGGMLLGWRTVCAVEIEDYPRRVLLQRQADGILPRFPIWDDVRTFDGKPWQGKVDVISGGFPCQDISSSGRKEGIDGVKSRLWSEVPRIANEIMPQFIFLENSPGIIHRGLARIISDLARIGYDIRWDMFSASQLGGRHKRKRWFAVAYPMGWKQEVEVFNARGRWEQGEVSRDMAWPSNAEPAMVGVVDGYANRLDRMRAIGNGQVPIVAATAWRILTQ